MATDPEQLERLIVVCCGATVFVVERAPVDDGASSLRIPQRVQRRYGAVVKLDATELLLRKLPPRS
ncbi:MAG: hypothetical protein ACE5LB_17640, partial [Acidiferrobacterales bacterium]